MTQKIFLGEKYQKTQNFIRISNSLMPAFKKLLKKLKAKTTKKWAKTKHSKFA
jgi:hypothetical protein